MTVGRIPNIEGGIQPTLLTTAGDTLYASSASNPARLGIGTAGQVLTVNSGATAPEWTTISTSAYTSLATGTLSTTEVSLTSISGAYTDLILYINNPYVNVATNLAFRTNGQTGATYSGSGMRSSQSALFAYSGQTIIKPNDNYNLPTVSTTNHSATLIIKNYAQANNKTIIGEYASSQANTTHLMVHSTPDNKPAITSIQIRTENGTSTFSGGTYTLYGVK